MPVFSQFQDYICAQPRPRLQVITTHQGTPACVSSSDLAGGGLSCIKIGFGEYRPNGDSGCWQHALARRRLVDCADDGGDCGAQVPERGRRGDHRATGGDDVLDQNDVLARGIVALGELARAVLLGLLAYEQGRPSGQLAEHGRDRHAAEFQAAEQLGVRRELGRSSARQPGVQQRIGLEQVLVEVFVGDLAGAQHEVAVQPAGAYQCRGRAESCTRRPCLDPGLPAAGHSLPGCLAGARRNRAGSLRPLLQS